MNHMDTKKGSLMENFFPAGWDMDKINRCCSYEPSEISERQTFWNKDFHPISCANLQDFEVYMGHEIANEIRNSKLKDEQIAFILPVGPMGMYRWTVYFLKEWKISCEHVHTFNMDEWSDSQGNTLPPDAKGSFQNAMENSFFNELGSLTVPVSQRNFATKENLPLYEEKINALRKDGANLILVFGIGRVFHIAFWEPHFAADFNDEESWKQQAYRLGAVLHPLTIEQNALGSFKSRTTLVPCYANTIGPKLMLQADKIIGGCDGVFGRGMHWQGMSLWVTLRYGPDIWVPSSFIPTLPGKLFFINELAGPLTPDCN